MKLRKLPDNVHPPLLYPAYGSTRERAPRQRPIPLPAAATELSAPRFDEAVLTRITTISRRRCQGARRRGSASFEGEAANLDDGVLALCAARASTLIAKRDAGDANAYAWNISLQGTNETVFFEA